jgi:hypothetical protein
MTDESGGPQHGTDAVPQPSAEGAHRTAAKVMNSHRCILVYVRETSGAGGRFASSDKFA